MVNAPRLTDLFGLSLQGVMNMARGVFEWRSRRSGGRHHASLGLAAGRRLVMAVRHAGFDQIVIAIEDLAAAAAADQAAAQLQLVIGDPKCRLAKRTLRRQRHQRPPQWRRRGIVMLPATDRRAPPSLHVQPRP